MNIFERLRKEKHKDENDPEKSWSVADLVEAFKKVDPNSTIDRNKINRIENGSQSPDAKTLIAYSKVFDVSVDYLLGLSNSRYLDEDIVMISRVTGLSDASIDKLKNYSDLHQNIIDVLLSSHAIDKLITAYIYKNSQFFQNIEIVDSIYGKRTASKEETNNFHLFQSIELLKESLNIISSDSNLFDKLNHMHAEIAGERMYKMAIDMEIEFHGLEKTIERIHCNKKSVPNYVLDYIDILQKAKGSDVNETT